MWISRRSALAALAVSPVVACSAGTPGRPSATPTASSPRRVAYGSDPAQYADLHLPAGDGPHPVVVVIHGGFWRSEFDASLGTPLAEDLVRRGYAAWNLEYRRVGNGGGWPATCDDVSTGIDALAGVDGLDLSRVVTLGHSAGGHLAVWAAGRAEASVPVTGAVSQAGVLDLVRAAPLGNGAVEAFLGAPPADVPEADPVRRLPIGVPVVAVHGTSDDIVPLEQSESYVAAATAAGDRARVVPVEGDHFSVITLETPAWEACVAATQELLGR